MGNSMNAKELEGRLAALEFVASLAVRTYGLGYASSAWIGGQHKEKVDVLIAKIDSGEILSPDDPEAKEVMKKSLMSMFLNPPSYPPYVGP